MESNFLSVSVGFRPRARVTRSGAESKGIFKPSPKEFFLSREGVFGIILRNMLFRNICSPRVFPDIKLITHGMPVKGCKPL